MKSYGARWTLPPSQPKPPRPPRTQVKTKKKRRATLPGPKIIVECPTSYMENKPTMLLSIIEVASKARALSTIQRSFVIIKITTLQRSFVVIRLQQLTKER